MVPTFVQDHQHVLALLGNKNHGVTAGPNRSADAGTESSVATVARQRCV
jgi:hypothetical protein